MLSIYTVEDKQWSKNFTIKSRGDSGKEQLCFGKIKSPAEPEPGSRKRHRQT